MSVVPDAAVDGPEGGQQPAPSIVAAFQHFLAVLVGGFPQLLAERRDGVVLVVELVIAPGAAVPAPRRRRGTPAAS